MPFAQLAQDGVFFPTLVAFYGIARTYRHVYDGPRATGDGRVLQKPYYALVVLLRRLTSRNKPYGPGTCVDSVCLTFATDSRFFGNLAPSLHTHTRTLDGDAKTSSSS